MKAYGLRKSVVIDLLLRWLAVVLTLIVEHNNGEEEMGSDNPYLTDAVMKQLLFACGPFLTHPFC